MAENTGELEKNEINWKIAQQAAGDAMVRVAEINATRIPENLTAAESPIKHGGRMIEQEARYILNLVADKDGDEKPGEGKAAGTEGVLVPLKEYMNKHPKLKSLATAAMLGTTLATAACASREEYRYNNRIDQVETRNDSDEARANNAFNRKRADLNANSYKYTPNEYKKRLAEINADYRKDLNRINENRANAYVREGRQANDREIRDRQRSAEETRNNAERTVGGVVDTLVGGFFGKGTPESRKKRINNTLSRGARNAAGQIVEEIFR